jgi:hypothetical protein
MPVLGELARWGYAWTWSSPRDCEANELGAIFRLAPGLLASAGITGVVELTVIESPGLLRPPTRSRSNLMW